MRMGKCILLTALVVSCVTSMVCAGAPNRTADVEQINAMIRRGEWKPVMTKIRQQPILAQSKDAMGATPLHFAAEQGYVQLGSWLLTVGAKVNSQDYTGQTPLHKAADTGHAAMCQMLIKHGANVRAVDIDGLTPLHVASKAKCVKVLADAGAPVDARDKLSLTPLFYAVASARADVVKALIQAHANVNIRDRKGKTALVWAQERKLTEIASLLEDAE
ncbi:MAG: ankyrin repeat domain-containing protein [Armatimonadota bacterium]